MYDPVFVGVDQHQVGVAAGGDVALAVQVEHVIAQDGSSTFKRTLAGGTVLITRDYDKLNKQTGEDTCYLLRDHLGSLTTVLNKHGILIQPVNILNLRVEITCSG